MNDRQLYRSAAFVLAGVLTIALVGCAPTVLPPTKHAPTTSGAVKIYQEQPAKYEALGTITVPVTPAMRWDNRGESVPGIDALKAKAAAMGANGVLLIAEPRTSDFRVTVGYHGEWYEVPMKSEPRSAVAQAIFVVDK